MNHFPIFADLNNRPVLLIGAGNIAQRKADSLLRAGALLRVVSRELSPAFRQWLEAGRIDWIAHEFDAAQLDGVFLVVSATGDRALDETVFAACNAAARLCNTVDQLEQCSFIMPAVIDRSPIQVAISTGGTSPVLARYWRQQIERLLPQHLGTLADIAGRWRRKVQAHIPAGSACRRFWEQLFASRFDALVANGEVQAAEVELQQQLDGFDPAGNAGSVTLVAAGPGDAGLLTLDALRAMQAADVVFLDEQVPDAIRQQIRKDAERIQMPSRTEEQDAARPADNAPGFNLHRQLIDAARGGQRVVLLRGGTDPFIFERGRQLARHLQPAGIPLRVIPGVHPAPPARALWQPVHAAATPPAQRLMDTAQG